jgi:pyruvate dehydrogenase E1 component alpha subunit
MLLIRRFEEKAAEMYQRARIGGYCHLNLGEEATCVGTAAGLLASDYMFTNDREHGYALARGIDPGAIMAELFGREGGVSRGRGGSMHLFSSEHRLMGGYAIVGGQLPLATGAGLAITRLGTNDVVLCQMGDATTNIGAFHESLNLASLWKLPVIYTIVNNGYGMGTPVERGSAVPELHKKAVAYGMHGERVDGDDVFAVRAAVQQAADRARGEHLPSLLELISFRLKGHSVVDPDRYRSETVLREVRSHDPLTAFPARLEEVGFMSPSERERLEAAVEKTVADAVAFAEKSPEPDPTKLFEFSYATPVANQPHALPGEQAWQS